MKNRPVTDILKLYAFKFVNTYMRSKNIAISLLRSWYANYFKINTDTVLVSKRRSGKNLAYIKP